MFGSNGFAARQAGWFFAVVALAGTIVSPLAQAQEAAYPSRPVTMVVPFPAGGALDSVARLVAEKLGARFGQSFIVENRPGAGGTVGSASVARSKPDGHTLLVASTGTISIAPAVYKKLSFQPAELTPIAQMTTAPLILATSMDFPGDTVADLVRFLQQNPGKHNYASTGNGTLIQLAAELFKLKTGTQAAHIPYAGGPQAATAMLRGDALFTITNVPIVLPHIQAGKLKGIASSGLKRSALLPPMPTIAESGLADFDVPVWIGLFGPRDLPPQIADKLNAAVAEAMRDPEIIRRLALQGDEPASGSPREFAQMLARETDKWGELARRLNIAID